MTDSEILTGSRGWAANPNDYNCLNMLKFSSDGSGQLVLGYGQTLLAEVKYRYELRPDGGLRLVFLDASENEFLLDANALGRQLVEAQHGDPRDLKYSLRMGDFERQMNMGSENGPFRYHFRAALTLDGPPYSEPPVLRLGHRLFSLGHPPVVTDYTYYGHPVVTNVAAIRTQQKDAG